MPSLQTFLGLLSYTKRYVYILSGKTAKHASRNELVKVPEAWCWVTKVVLFLFPNSVDL